MKNNEYKAPSIELDCTTSLEKYEKINDSLVLLDDAITGLIHVVENCTKCPINETMKTNEFGNSIVDVIDLLPDLLLNRRNEIIDLTNKIDKYFISS